MPINDSITKTAKDAAVGAVDKAGEWFGGLREKVTEWVHDLDITAVKVVEIFSYVGIGFFAGFLFKKYLRAILLFMVMLGITIWALEEFDLIAINWIHAQELANVTPSDTISTLFYGYVDWVKQNMLVVLSVFSGFLVGYKVG